VKPRSSIWQHIKCPKKQSPVTAAPAVVAAPTEDVITPRVEPVPSVPAPVVQPVQAPVPDVSPVAGGQPGATASLLKKLETMALDATVGDKEFRGASWMLCRYLSGGR